VILRENQSAINNRIRQTLGESFNIFQATIAMIAIFLGFVFSGLLQLLTSDILDRTKMVVWILLASMLLLTLAIILMHATAHRVIRFYQIFYPVSIFNKIGAICFSGGLLFMLWSIAALLWINNMLCEAVVVFVLGATIVVFGFYFRRMHERGASYMVNVDDNIP